MTTNVIASFVTPYDCLLLIVTGGAGDFRNDECRYAELIAFAAEYRIPVISIATNAASSQVGARTKHAIISLKSTLADPLADDAVIEAVNHYNRRKIIVTGTASEGSVTFLALSALARGFDVHVVEDICESSSERVHNIAMKRLEQAGAVLTTAAQLRMEWSAFSEQHAAASSAQA